MEGIGMTVAFLILAAAARGELSGDNVCQEERRYTINVTEYFVRNSTIRNYEWCLNVPPRCSFYTTRVINDSRIVEKEVADVIDTCCPGYIEDGDANSCIPECPECVNGTCVQGRCDCFPGYKGAYCDSECDDSEWGKNCEFKCICENGRCDSETGSCICPPGWTGNTCHLPCPGGSFGPHCRQQCKCQMCDHVTGECETTTTTLTTERITPPITETAPTTIRSSTIQMVHFRNNGKFEVDGTGFIPTTSIAAETEREVRQTSSIVAVTTVRAKTMTTDSPQEENYLKGDFDRPPVNKNDLVNGASAATAISVAVIVVAVVIVATNHFVRTKKKMEEEERNKGMPTVSVYAHSIFHTPLPEPPTFENPIFVTPLETSPPVEGQRFETRVVCSMNFPAHPHKDSKEYTYDHPPSTGSYRAASIPEPPDMVPVTHGGEPLYDEIPSGMIPTPVSTQPPSYKTASLYMNTCGKTRL